MELDKISQTLDSVGFTLDEKQPQLSGERFLMTKDKWVLIGKEVKTDRKVVIKISNLPLGREEIVKEKMVRDLLQNLSFAEDNLLIPTEIYYGEKDGLLIFVTAFIPQERVFSAYPLEEQFFMSLTIFEEQEAFHATTFEHRQKIQTAFDVYNLEDYLRDFELYKERVKKISPESNATLTKALELLRENSKLLKTHNNYLTHTDLAPGNTRIHNREIYMLDLSSIRFGNKYEGWARFLNWALIHSPELETLLSNYVLENRGPEEVLCLRLMRIFKAGLLLDYYARSLPKTSDDLHLLIERRIKLWSSLISSFVAGNELDQSEVQAYREARNKLRSKEEIERQQEFNIPNL